MENGEQISGEQLRAQPSCIGPNYSFGANGDTRGNGEKLRDQLLEQLTFLVRGKREAGCGKWGPETGEHVPEYNPKPVLGLDLGVHSRLAETMDYVEQKRRELLQSLDGVPGEKLCRRADPSGWSVAEILEHLRMVESGVARMITKRVAKARDEGAREETSTTSVMSSFAPYASQLEGVRLQSPVAVQPRADVDVNETLEGLESSREALRLAVVSADGLALGEIKHPHAILGELDLYQWLIFVGGHEARHRKQIERTLQSLPE